MSDAEQQAGVEPRLFYGYFLAGYAFLACFAVASIFLHARGILFPYWIEEFGVTRTELSVAVTATLMTGGIIAPVTGYLLDRFPVRVLVTFGWCWLAVGYTAMQYVDSFAAFMLLLVVFQGIGWTYVGPLAQTKLMVCWFNRHRGTALGVAIMGISVAGIVMPAVNTWLAETQGWRGTYQVFVVALVAVMVPATWLMVRESPQSMGLLPDGDVAPPEPLMGAETANQDKQPIATAAAEKGLWTTYAEFLSAKSFWSVVLTFGLMNGVYSAMMTHLPLYLTTELSFTLYQASGLISVAGVFAIVGKIVMGWMMDRFPAKFTVLLAVGVYISSTIVFMTADNLILLSIAAGLFGMGFGGMVPVRSVLLSRLFGVARFSRVNGLLSFFLAPATLWIVVTGYLADTTGTYVTAFKVWAVAFCIAGLVTWFIRLPNVDEGVDEGVGDRVA